MNLKSLNNKFKKIVFIGLHAKTLPLLYGNFDVMAVSYIDNFSNKTLNFANIIFKIIYLLRKKDKCRLLEISLLKIWKIAKCFSSSVFRDYGYYLELISQNRTKILDVDDKEYFKSYIKEKDVDLVLVNTWGMLSDDILNVAKFGTVNIHPSELPKYKGSVPTLWYLKNRDTKAAITYMLLNESMDGGDIISQHVFNINEQDNWLSLEEKINRLIEKTLVKDISDYLNHRLKPIAQDKTKESFTAKYEAYRKINWRDERAVDIYNKVNLYPFVDPGVYCYTYFNKKKIFIKHAEYFKKERSKNDFPKFKIEKLSLLADAEDGIIKIRLFRDINFSASIRLLLKGNFNDFL